MMRGRRGVRGREVPIESTTMTLLLIMLAAIVAGALLWKFLLLTLDAEDRGRTDIVSGSDTRDRDARRVLSHH